MDLLLSWFNQNQKLFSGEVQFQIPLSKFCYYQIGGKADVLVFPKNEKDLQLVSQAIRETKAAFCILGAGSNTLISDHGFPGIVIITKSINHIIEFSSVNSHDMLRIGSSVLVSTVLRFCEKNGLGGLEFLVGVPGSMGGCVAMNAGTGLGEIKDRLIEIEVFNLENGTKQTVSNPEMQYTYRSNQRLKPTDIVLSSVFRVTPRAAEDLKIEIKSLLEKRKSNQPIEMPSCGSVFKNPCLSGQGTLRAWEVLDRCGLRGVQKGQAQFSQKHPNFIVNLGGAKAEDVKTLIELAKKEAFKKLGIVLQEEVKYLGF